MDNLKSNKLSLSSGFCLTCFALIVFMCCNMCSSHKQLKQTQGIIINSHRDHIKKVESYIKDYQTLLEDEYSKISFNSLKILDSLTHLPKNKQKVIAKDFYQGIIASMNSNYLNDASTIKQQFDIAYKELLLNQNNLDKLLELHYAELSNQQRSLTTWATVLSIIFLTFGFFAIFKIEESKKEANKLLHNIDRKCKVALEDLTKVDSEIFRNIQNSNNAISSLSKKETELEKIITSLNEKDTDISIKISNILEGCNSLEEHINRYTSTMNDRYQLRLNTTIDQGNKIIKEMKDKFDLLVKEFEEIKTNKEGGCNEKAI